MKFLKPIFLIGACLFFSNLSHSRFFPFSNQSAKEVLELKNNEDFSFHLNTLTKIKSLMPKTPLNPLNYPPNEEKFLFKGIKFSTHHYGIAKVPCEQVHFAHRSALYLEIRYKALRKKSLTYLKKLINSEGPKFDYYEKRYFKVIEEIEEVIHLIKGAYSPLLNEVDRTVIYKLIPGAEFKRILKDKKFRPSGEFRVFKIKVGRGSLIPFSGQLDGYMNFSSHLFLLGKSVHIRRELTPIEACLERNNIFIFAKTLKEKYRRVTLPHGALRPPRPTPPPRRIPSKPIGPMPRTPF